ncbi:restriction endonuclease subunit S [Cetobacterium sp. 2G large]|uniref:restriction endonuclease subunit S n=1 Tax=Cetobacterium sp. 2G large TaxID=2759680 RepID=UPI00163D3A4A|nr:restriction endonuclease subunit S [Cetobacterium sp. 2G large]MBC2854712.1 restriction endonuclease subunit S [Cetobacterium sp. 2G large]
MSKKKKMTIEDKLKEALILVKDQPYAIPSSWKWIKLKGICEVKGGKRIPKGYSYSEKKTANFYLRVTDFENKTINLNNLKYITDEVSKKIEKYKITNKDIYMSIAGTIGKVGLIPEELNNSHLTENAVKLTNLHYVKKKYLLNYLESSFIKNEISKSIVSSGQPKLAIFRIENFKVPLPPLEEQERIVNKLDSMLGRINEAKELIAQAKETFENRRASILNLAFSGELTRKWRESNSIESSKILLENLNKEKIILWEEECEKALEEGKKKPSKPKLLSVEEMIIPKEEQPYEIPDNWEWVKLEEIIEYTTNLDIQKKLDKNETINYVDIESINNKLFKINTIKEKKVSELSTRARRVLKKGYMMYSLVRPYLNNFALIEEEKENFIGSTGFAVFKSKVSPIKYIFYYMQTNYIKEYYQSFLKGFNSPSITIENFNSTSVPLPPLEEQKEIVRILDNVLEKEDKINEILELEEMIELLEKSILDKAFRGELGTGNLEDVPSLEVLKNILEK